MLGAELIPGVSIKFIIAMPRSWSKKKKEAMAGTPHCVRPDLKNLLEALEDAVFYKQKGGDAHMWSYDRLEKRWGKKGKIIITY